MNTQKSSQDISHSKTSYLEERLKYNRKRLIIRDRIKRFSVVVGLLLLAITILIYFTKNDIYITGVLFIYGVFLIIMPIIIFPRSHIESEIEDISNELGVLTTDTNSLEQRAEKLFKLHQIDLKKYYDLTLSHSRWIFVVGVLCILVGLLIIGGTLLYLLNNQVNLEFNEKIVIGSLAAVGGILSNFIAVIYLKMFSEIVKSLTEFHNRLVNTHHLHFSNYLISKITDDELREEKISQIALEIAKIK